MKQKKNSFIFLYQWFVILLIDCSDTDEGDMGLDSTVLVDDNITDCDVTDEDQEMIERVRSSFYFPH